MIRDTSAQDRQIKIEPQHGKRWLKIGLAAAAAGALFLGMNIA